ncbi:MAG: hypothetical protein H0V66_05685 [Bdellovibrionales bacterium]|nr:hypothetical protein [Bdellovibrionales bacterium]
MRLISALLCFCLTFNVMAASGTVQELERALDDYQYALTVDWDQKDANFVTEKTEAFYLVLSQLMEKGLTQKEVMDLVAKKSKNPKEMDALVLKMELLTKQASSSDELALLMTKNANTFYATGASWEGYYIASIGIGIVVAALIGYSIWWDSKRTCVATAQGQECGWVSPYYGAPQNTHYYQCWQTTYCTEYQEN